MKTFSLFITTKNPKSLKSFLHFLVNQSHKNDVFFLTKIFFLKKNKQIFTLLKSPHVNKSAQEQFEVKTLTLQINFNVVNIYKCLIFLKKINNTLFADISFKLKFFHNVKKQISLIKTINNKNKLKYDFFFIKNSFKKIKKIKVYKFIQKFIQKFNKTRKIYFYKRSLNLFKYNEIKGS
jgi:ribosomal protein S10